MDKAHLNISNITWDRVESSGGGAWQHGACYNPFQGTLLASRVSDDVGAGRAEIHVVRGGDSSKRVLYADPSAYLDLDTTRLRAYLGSGTEILEISHSRSSHPEDGNDMFNVLERRDSKLASADDLIGKLNQANEIWIAAYKSNAPAPFHVRHFNIAGAPDFGRIAPLDPLPAS